MASCLLIAFLLAVFIQVLLSFYRIEKKNNLFSKTAFLLANITLGFILFWLVYKSKHLFCKGLIPIYLLYSCK